MTADPYRASAGAGDPGSWNRYAYVGGDPVNRLDPQGLAQCWVTLYVTDYLGGRAYVRCTSEGGIASDGGELEAFNPGDPEDEKRILAEAQRRWGAQVDQQAARQGRQVFIGIVDRLEGLAPSGLCRDTLKKLPTTDGQGVSFGQLIGALRKADLKDALTSPEVADDFTNKPGLDFRVQGNTIYYRSSYVVGAASMGLGDQALLAADILHEALHLLGYGDGTIAEALGVTITSTNTSPISNALFLTCTTPLARP